MDILVNAAGLTVRSPALDLRGADFAHVLAVNVTGSFLCAREAARRMRERGGAIVNVASIMGFSGGLFPNVAYNTSKGGVVNLTRALAVEWAPLGIRVNAVAPTYVATDLTRGLLADAAATARVIDAMPLRRLATADEVAEAVLFLAGPGLGDDDRPYAAGRRWLPRRLTSRGATAARSPTPRCSTRARRPAAARTSWRSTATWRRCATVTAPCRTSIPPTAARGHGSSCCWRRPGPGPPRCASCHATIPPVRPPTSAASCSEAGLARRDTIIWNAVPQVIHAPGARNRAPRRAEVATGLAELPGFVALLPRLRAVVLAGRVAGAARAVLAAARPDLTVLEMPHPSPTFVCTSPAVPARIRAALAEAAAVLARA